MSSSSHQTLLHQLVSSYIVRWDRVARRLQSHPEEASSMMHGASPSVLVCALCRRIDDYPSFDMIQALLNAYPPAVWNEATSRRNSNTLTSPLEAACWRRASLPILQLLVNARPSVLDADVQSLIALWTSYSRLFGNDRDFIEHICSSGREGAMIWTKLHLLLRYCSDESLRFESWRGVHAAAATPSCPLELFKILLEVYPEQLRQRDDKGRLPLHLQAEASVMDDDTSSAHQATTRFNMLLDAFSKAARVRDGRGRLALHVAIASGLPWVCLKALMCASPNTLARRDKCDYLYPFLLAAASPKATLSTVYQLLRNAPHLIHPHHPCTQVQNGVSPETVQPNGQMMICSPKRNISSSCDPGGGNVQEATHILMKRVGSSDSSELWNALQVLLSYKSSSNDDKAATTMPSWFVVHAAAATRGCPIGMLKLALRMHPEQVQQTDDKGRLPLHLAVALIPTDEEHSAAWLDNESDEAEDDETAITTQRVKIALHAFPEAAKIRYNGRLPLHLAIASGQPWDCLGFLIGAYPDALVQRDAHTRLFPFALAACSPHASLNSLYRLLEAAPHLVNERRRAA